jgi:hypothetical protein
MTESDGPSRFQWLDPWIRRMSRWEHGRPESIDSSAAGEIKPRHDDSVRCYHLVSSCFILFQNWVQPLQKTSATQPTIQCRICFGHGRGIDTGGWLIGPGCWSKSLGNSGGKLHNPPGSSCAKMLGEKCLRYGFMMNLMIYVGISLFYTCDVRKIT